MKSKITDEMIMDFADGILSENDSKRVISLLKKNKLAREKFLKFQKTSLLFGAKNEEFYENQPIPESLLNLVSKKNIVSPHVKYIDKLKYFFSGFAFRQNLVVACCALIIGFFGSTILEQDKENIKIYRSNLDSTKINSDMVKIFADQKFYEVGDLLPSDSEFKIVVSPVLTGELILDFPEENLSFTKKVIKGKKIEFPENNKLTFTASPPYISFQITLSDELESQNKVFYFVVK